MKNFKKICRRAIFRSSDAWRNILLFQRCDFFWKLVKKTSRQEEKVFFLSMIRTIKNQWPR